MTTVRKGSIIQSICLPVHLHNSIVKHLKDENGDIRNGDWSRFVQRATRNQLRKEMSQNINDVVEDMNKEELELLRDILIKKGL